MSELTPLLESIVDSPLLVVDMVDEEADEGEGGDGEAEGLLDQAESAGDD